MTCRLIVGKCCILRANELVHAIIIDLLVHAILSKEAALRITQLVQPIVLQESPLNFAHSTLFGREAGSPREVESIGFGVC